jgi:predicted Ser/Thr protein kinase
MVSLKVVQKVFTYEEAKEFLTDYWYCNPQEIVCYEQKYFEVAEFEPRLSNDPRRNFCNDFDFFAFSTLFGEELLTYKEAKDYCTGEYNKLPEGEKPNSLTGYYQELREGNNRLPSSPDEIYKNQGWIGYWLMFGLPEPIALYTYEATKDYCTGEYNKLPEGEKPNSLQSYYQELREGNNRLPSNPHKIYKKQGCIGYWLMFGLPEPIALYTYEATKDYCTGEYNKLPEGEKPNCLQSYYQELREGNNRLPSVPHKIYKKQGCIGYWLMFGLPEPIALYTYEAAKVYCTGEYNKLSEGEKPNNLQSYYQELREGNNRLPSDPHKIYKKQGCIGYWLMFGLPEPIALYTYEAAKVYCTGEYNKLSEGEKPNNLQSYYQELKEGNNRLPSNPHKIYKKQGCIGYWLMFGLPEPIALYTYEATKDYCTGEYNKLSEGEKPNNLTGYYKELREGNNRLPSDPHKIYKKQGWIGIKGMFGIG